MYLGSPDQILYCVTEINKQVALNYLVLEEVVGHISAWATHTDLKIPMSAMQCIHTSPDQRLSHLVQFYWQLDVSGSLPPQRLLPYVEAELIIQPNNPVRYRTRALGGNDSDWRTGHHPGVMKGVFPAYLELDYAAGTRVFGIRFKPFGMYPFVHSPAHELTQAFTNIQDLFGRAGRMLVEQVQEACDLYEVSGVFDRFLLERLGGEHRIDKRIAAACRALVNSRGLAPVDEVAGGIQLGVRQLERLFNRQIGVSPSTFGGLIRLNNFVELAQRSPESTLTTLAFDCGFYDQPHLSRTFRRFVGTSPSEYLDSFPALQRNLARDARLCS